MSNFSFLRAGSHPEELAARAADLGLEALAIADVNSVSGIVRAHAHLRQIAREIATRDSLDPIGPPRPAHIKPAPRADIDHLPRLLPAARLVFSCGLELTALPRDRAGWGNLCRLLTLGRRRAPKGECHLELADLDAFGDGLELILHSPPKAHDPARAEGLWQDDIARLAARFGTALWAGLTPFYDGQDGARWACLAAQAERLGLRLVALSGAIMHHGSRRRMVDVLTAIRLHRRVADLGQEALANAENRLRGPAEMRRLFADYPHAIDGTLEIAARCQFRLDDLRYEYPSETAQGETAQARLERLAWAGLARRYPQGPTPRAQDLMRHELALIAKLGYAPYFLTVHDIVDFARGRGILCQGRGSAANSVTCYALGVTAVSPEIGTMVFERFVSEARDEPPDIDVDFEHERREEVIQWIYDRYGRHRAGLCATVIHYRAKRAIREVGRAMGLTEDVIASLSGQIWGSWGKAGFEPARLREIGLDPDSPILRLTLDLIEQVIGFPRHLSQHVGGFVITQGRLDELVPIENAAMEDRSIIAWDKDDIDTLGILKVDILALGMLTCIQKALDLVALHAGARFDLATIPPEDKPVYDMLCRADSLGVFQVESRAQMNFLPRMRPRNFYDLVIQVAIIRPGPIQGDMVHPFIRRRNGQEAVSFPSDALGEVLAKTLGVPLFQEQAMQIAIVGAGFTPLEADRLRRALATFKKKGHVSEFRARFLRGMQSKGYDRAFSERCFAQIEGFGSYGFPESHAASFALLVYASAWLKCHYPAAFACALLNSQPMGFYAPAQIIRDARAHGVEIRPVCVNASAWDHGLERDETGRLALRLGLRQIRGLGEEDAHWIIAARGNGYSDLRDIWRRAGVGQAALRALVEADACAALGLGRRAALWELRGLDPAGELPLFAGDLGGEIWNEPAVQLPKMPLGEALVKDYHSLGLSLRSHPVALLRHKLSPSWVAKAQNAPALRPPPASRAPIPD